MRPDRGTAFNLRPYQRECIDSIPESGSYLIQMATGLGKTVTMSRIPRRGRMLILSHREELVRQPRKYFPCSFGIEQGKSYSAGEEIVSASVQSMSKRLERFSPDDFDVIVTDEAHHATAATYRKIYEWFRPRLHLGFTATPNRADGTGLEAVFSDIIFERDLPWGIRNGWLSPIRCLRAEIGYDLRGVARRMGDYAPGELERAVNIEGANKAIAEVYAKKAVGQTLVFAVSVAHAKAIAREIPGAVAVAGGEERAGTVAAFARKEIKCLVNCMVFTEGTDIPGIETVVIARPTQNVSLYTQMVGRGCRLAEGKERLTLIDCVGASALNLCTAPSLLGLSVGDLPLRKQKEIEGDLFDLPELAEKASDCPEYWIKNMEVVDLWARSRKYNTHDVNWYRMPDGEMVLSFRGTTLSLPPEDSLGRTVWYGERVPMQRALDSAFLLLRNGFPDEAGLWSAGAVKRWGNAQASEKQRALVSRFLPGLDAERLTKKEAMLILTRCFHARTTGQIPGKTT